MKQFWERHKFDLLAFAVFLVVAFVLYSPLLEGKKLMGSDSIQFRAMEHERIQWSQRTGHDVYWTGTVFGGMPTYLLGADFPYNLPGRLARALKFFPKPVNFLFLYFLGFFVLMWAMRLRPLYALAGALGFTLSTYLIIILQVGHFAKAEAVAFFPWVLAGVWLIAERRKYTGGFVLLALAMALEVEAKHYQMTYYLGLALMIYGLFWLWEIYRKGEWKHFLRSMALMLGAVIIGTGMNWSSLSAIREYISQSIRGKQFVTINPDGSPRKISQGLDRNYITEYSYGPAESFNLFIPGFMGGSNREKLGENSHLYRALMQKNVRPADARKFVENTSLYWGKQPIVMAPAYIGAVILFLALMGFLLVRGRTVRWMLTVSIVALLLSWGKHLPWLTDAMIDYFPMYNKFRAVASVQVLLEWLLPVVAVLGIIALTDKNLPKQKKTKALKIAAGTLGGLALFFWLLGGQLFHFESAQDGIYQQYGLLDALIADRQALLRSDAFRSLLFVLAAAGLVWAYLRKGLDAKIMAGGLALLVILDLGGVAKRYIRDGDFMSKREIDRYFRPTPVDKAIMQDQSYYRVINFARNPLTDGMTSYFHKNLGGYHAAKPRRIQDIFDFYLTDSIHYPVLNMYNVKYIIFRDKKGLQYSPNPAAFGPAWFVQNLQFVPDDNAEILALRSADLRHTAILQNSYTGLKNFRPQADSTARIRFDKYTPEALTYTSQNPADGFAVFSENYYPYGWKAYIDGKPVPIYKVNYSLRGLRIPAGRHKIDMRFEPEVIRKGGKISLLFIVLFLLGIAYWLFELWKKRQASVSA